MAKVGAFKLALTSVIESTGGAGIELPMLEDVERFIGLLKPWRQAWPPSILEASKAMRF